MPGIIQDGVARSGLVGMEALAQFLTNLAQGIVESKELSVSHEIRAALHHIAVSNMPFSDKIDELSKAGSAIEDPQERKRFMEQLVKVEQEGEKVKEGLDEVRRYVRKSGMREEDKTRILKEVDRCEKSLQNVYVAKVPGYTYRSTMKLVNQNGLADHVTAMSLANGNYAFFYPAACVPMMDKILETASLMYEQHPRPEAVRTEAVMTAQSKSNAAVLRFENLSPELAERAVLESGKYGFISMAKEERLDGTGNFDIICNAGGTQEEKNRNLREAIEILSRAAMALSGPDAEIEKRRMRHSAREYASLKEGLTGSGYVFSIHTKEQKVGDKREQFIDVGQFVRFDQEKFRSYHDGIAEKLVVNRSETDTRYESMLYAAAQSGTGQKVFVSEERMKEMQEEAAKVYNDLKSLMGERPMNERMDMVAELQTKMMNLAAERQKYRQQKNHGMQQAVSAEMRQITAQIEALILAGNNPVTETNVLDRIVAQELDSHRFRYFVKDKDLAERAKVVRKCTDYGVRSTREEASMETENRMRTETMGTGKDYSIGWEMIAAELDRVDPEAFLMHEFEQASADAQNLPDDRLKVSDVKREAELLRESFNETKQNAEQMLEGVRIRMQGVALELDEQTIATPFASQNARDYLNHIREMDQSLFGVSSEDRQERQAARELERERDDYYESMEH